MPPIDASNEETYSLVILGASGLLARQKLFPTLWTLFRDNRLPQNLRIFNFCRTLLQTKSLRIQVLPYMSLDRTKDPDKYNRFWKIVDCIQGEYDKVEHFMSLAETILEHEAQYPQSQANRIFYLALPPVVLDAVAQNISRKCGSPTGWTRIVLEKPFGRDDLTYRPFQNMLCSCFKESQIFLMDHLLSKRVLQNFLALRYGNYLWGATLNNQHVAAVMISVKCEHPVKASQAEYFNQMGIIRDLMTNHMIQILAMIIMDQPYANTAEDLRSERLKALQQVLTLTMSDLVFAQYRNNGREGDPAKCGYLEHNYIPKDSIQPTFAMAVLNVNSRRWRGVPFILRAGKALNDSKSEVRIQYKPVPTCDAFYSASGEARNELVLRWHPTEEVFMRVRLKRQGEDMSLRETELNLRVDDRGPGSRGLDHYSQSLMDVFNGDQAYFMRTDEQCEIWRIFSPILNTIETDRPRPIYYDFGSRGPAQAYQLAANAGFAFFASDEWHESEETLEYTLKKSRILIGPHTALKPERQNKADKISTLSGKSLPKG
ncbi:hypothetical protein KR059_004774 [Drosophila kikkawai]|nr:hypothetical protein KR059_004774 [Drosophila kikkawai]